MFGLFDYWFQVRIHGFRIQDWGFRNRAINHSLITRQLILCYIRSLKKFLTLEALQHEPSNGQRSVEDKQKNNQLGILSPFWYFKFPIGDILSILGLSTVHTIFMDGTGHRNIRNSNNRFFSLLLDKRSFNICFKPIWLCLAATLLLHKGQSLECTSIGTWCLC